MAPVEHREPYEARVSRTVLGARGGEIPSRDSMAAALHHILPFVMRRVAPFIGSRGNVAKSGIGVILVRADRGGKSVATDCGENAWLPLTTLKGELLFFQWSPP